MLSVCAHWHVGDVRQKWRQLCDVDWLIDWHCRWQCERVVVCCRPWRVWCDSVRWRCLHSLSVVLSNHQVPRYNTAATDRHQRQGLDRPTWHRRLSTNVSALSHWLWVYLASVVRWWRHTALVDKFIVGHIRATDTVSDVITRPGDVT